MIIVALFVFVFVFFALGFLYFWGLNPGELTVFLATDLSFTLPTTIMLICALLCGLLLGNGVHLLSAFLLSISNWKNERRLKKAEAVGNLYTQGVAFLLSGDLNKARTSLTRALDRDAGRVDTYLALADVALNESGDEEAIDLLRRARKLEPKRIEVLSKLAGALKGVGRLEEAGEVCRELLASDAGNRRAMSLLRDILIDLDNWEGALELQKKIVKLESAGVACGAEKGLLLQLRYEVARSELEDGRVDQAVSACRDMIKKDGTFTAVRVLLGDAQARAGRGVDAVKTWQDGYATLKRSVFLTRLEDYFLEAEDPGSLLTFYRTQMDVDSADMQLKLYFCRLCLRLEMIDEALQHLIELGSKAVASSELHMLMAEAQRRRNNVEQALGEYRQALAIDNRLMLGFSCASCQTRFEEWQSRCPECGEWDTVIQ